MHDYVFRAALHRSAQVPLCELIGLKERTFVQGHIRVLYWSHNMHSLKSNRIVTHRIAMILETKLYNSCYQTT